MELEWKEPPPEATIVGKNMAIVAALKQKPGVWARLKKNVSAGSAADQFKKLGVQVVVHRINPRERPARYDIYGRWPAVPVRPAPPGATYKPEDRAARGIPADGLPVARLGNRNGARL